MALHLLHASRESVRVRVAVTRVPRRARDILKHCLDNPLMADSLEGIASWRLIEQIVQQRVTETEEALRWLVANGYLDRIACATGPPVYKLNPNRRADAERLLAARGQSRPAGRTRRKPS